MLYLKQESITHEMIMSLNYFKNEDIQINMLREIQRIFTRGYLSEGFSMKSNA